MAEHDIPQDEHLPIQCDLRYDMDRHKRGHALIFNNETFDNMNTRTGTKKDGENLSTTFAKFGFKVVVYLNNNAEEIRRNLQKASEMDHSRSDCFVCVFLTHGDDGIIYGSDGDPESFNGNGNVDAANRTWLELDDVFDIFRGDNCRSLIGKPKIFIIQACRGQEADSPVQVGGAPENYVINRGVGVTIPTEADFLTCYSSSRGYYSIREKDNGTWFIQDLTVVLNELGTTDFIQLLTVVNRLVSERTIEGSGNPNLTGIKQMPCFLSKLTRQLHLAEKNLVECTYCSNAEGDSVCPCKCDCRCQCHCLCPDNRPVIEALPEPLWNEDGSLKQVLK